MRGESGASLGAEMPEGRTGQGIAGLRAAARDCRACPLWKRATQTVFGAGAPHARLLFVGEQPGDEEDRQGLPFVGPAGRLLDEALAAAGIDRGDAYVTNAVKHFKWSPAEGRGKRRIHEKPNAAEIRACHPWLLAEIAAIRPEVIVCLGATAARALLGPAFRVTKQRGVPLPHETGARIVATVHPSAILRAPDSDTRHSEMQRFIADLRAARVLVSAQPSAPQP
jgi:uracil-DNA glycosylase family protein